MRTCIAIVAAGLRGAIAFALAKSSSSNHRVNITAATVGAVVVTVFAVGGSTRRLLTLLGLVESDRNAREIIKARDDQARDQERARSALLADQSMRAGGVRITLRLMLRRWSKRLIRLDVDVLQPMFIATADEQGSPTPAGAAAAGDAPNAESARPTAAPAVVELGEVSLSGGEQIKQSQRVRLDDALVPLDESRVRSVRMHSPYTEAIVDGARP